MNDTQTELTHQKRWLNPKELYAEYGFSISAQAKMRMNRRIPFNKQGGYILYDRLQIDKWLESNAVEVVA